MWSMQVLYIWWRMFMLRQARLIMTTEELWENYAWVLRVYIAQRLEGAAVDDILQQVFLRAHKKKDMLRDPNAIKSWLYRIAQHAIIDRYRKEWRSLQADDSYRESLEEEKSDSRHATMMNNISSCLLPMIDDLDEQSRKIMKLSLEWSMNYKQIAQECWLSEANIKVIVHRAKKKLKNMYSQCCYEYRDEKGRLIDTWCQKQCGCSNTPVG